MSALPHLTRLPWQELAVWMGRNGQLPRCPRPEVHGAQPAPAAVAGAWPKDGWTLVRVTEWVCVVVVSWGRDCRRFLSARDVRG